ncbi:MAG: LysR family transcriptional regulator [Chloroflexi bacterium]|nr:MAG: LysR family transcriptional regulator [Chloroflexota bacterium]
MQLEARLRAFAALARRSSFSAAAEELVISQPAVSKHVAELEAELGTKLVIRGPRRIQLTPAGEFVADHVERAEALVAQAARGARSLAGAETGRLAIGTSGTGMYLAIDAIAAFHTAHPRVELDVQIGTSEPIVELVRAHRAELAIVGGFTAARDVESETLIEDDIVIVAAPPVARAHPSLRDLERLTWISREEGSSTRAAFEAAWRDLGIAPAGRISLPSWEAVKLAVAKGAGVSGISRYAVTTELAAGTLAVVRVPPWRVRRHFSLVHARDIPLSPPAERFRSILLSELAKLATSVSGGRSRRAPRKTSVPRSGARRGRVRRA